MKSDIRNSLIFAAVVVSLGAHFGAMTWVRPRVMTHAPSALRPVAHRTALRVRQATARPETVAMEVVRDEPERRAAPAAEEPVAILPADTTAVASQAEPAALPDVTLPATVNQPNPTAAAPKFDTALPPDPAVGKSVPRMKLEAPKPGSGAAASSLALPTRTVASVPAFEAPIFAPVGHIVERQRQPEAPRIEEEKTPPKETFKPVEEVMAHVDEKIVAAEKKAVRSLLVDQRPMELKTIADASLATCFAGGFTYFRVTVRGKPRIPSVPKDVVVLIDASGSIGRDRLSSCRRAAREILRTAMNTGDRFNLVAFRDRFSYAFRTWQPCDAVSYAAADKWMMRLAAHGRTDVFSTISSVLTLPRVPSRPVIALVVTDGEANTGVSATADILSKFTALNDGLISVYMYGVKSSANLELIDVLTHGNRGESFIFDGWRWNAGDGIGAFSERFRDPLLTDLRVVFPSVCAAEAYPALLKNLYRDNAIELVGRIPGKPGEVAFSLRGIAGSLAYEGFYRLPVQSARADARLPALWQAERRISEKLR